MLILQPLMQFNWQWKRTYTSKSANNFYRIVSIHIKNLHTFDWVSPNYRYQNQSTLRISSTYLSTFNRRTKKNCSQIVAGTKWMPMPVSQTIRHRSGPIFALWQQCLPVASQWQLEGISKNKNSQMTQTSSVEFSRVRILKPRGLTAWCEIKKLSKSREHFWSR